MNITTKRGYTYERRAWTGGSVPTIDFENDLINKDLIEAFFNEQVSECGGLDLWECAGTSKNVIRHRKSFLSLKKQG